MVFFLLFLWQGAWSTDIRQQVVQEIAAFPGPQGAVLGYLSFAVPETEDPVLSYFSRLIPSMLVSKVGEIPHRYLDEQERRFLGRRALDRVSGRLLQSYGEQQRQKAQAFLRNTSFTPTGNRRELAKRAVSSLLPAREDPELGGYLPEVPRRVAVTVKRTETPVKPPEAFHRWYLSPEEILGQAYDPGSSEFSLGVFLRELERVAVEQQVHYLMFGRIRSLGSDRVSVDYGVYSRFSRTIIQSGSFFPPLSEAGDRAREISLGFAEEFSREDRGELVVRTFPPTFDILVNGLVRGQGQVILESFPTSPIDIVIQRGNTPLIVDRRQLVSGETNEWNFVVRPGIQPLVVLDSVPRSSKVLADGIPLGYTPVSAALPPWASVLEFQREGYHTRRIVLDSQNRSSGLNVHLLDERIDWSGRVRETRDRFYLALGISSVSLAVPMILNGLFEEAATVARNSTDPQMTNRANTLYFLRNGAWVLAGTAITNTLFELGNYMRTAKTAVTR